MIKKKVKFRSIRISERVYEAYKEMQYKTGFPVKILITKAMTCFRNGSLHVEEGAKPKSSTWEGRVIKTTEDCENTLFRLILEAFIEKNCEDFQLETSLEDQNE